MSNPMNDTVWTPTKDDSGYWFPGRQIRRNTRADRSHVNKDDCQTACDSLNVKGDKYEPLKLTETATPKIKIQ